jgi:hypothetical protein
MDHYEVRKYGGWHPHMLTMMLTHFFLWHLKLKLGKKAPALTAAQLRLLLEWCCPGEPIGLQTSWRSSPGGSSAITAPICPRESGERRRAKEAACR